MNQQNNNNKLNDDEGDDDDPDINFEVRSEKLSCQNEEDRSSISSKTNSSSNKNVPIDTSHLGINQKTF